MTAVRRILLTFSFFCIPALAAIPSGRMILDRTVENSGNGGYQIEQEIQFPNGFETLFLKETWMIDSDRNLKVVVNGPKELKAPIRFEILYTSGQKWTGKTGGRMSSKLPDDFFEKAFHMRSLENMIAYLTQEKIVPPNGLERKTLPKKSEEITFEPESFVRLARTGGAVTWAFGNAAAADGGDQPPGLWIEQDQFVIRKLRLPSKAEISADDYSAFAKGLSFPKTRTVRWGDHSLTIKTLQVASKKFPSSTFQPNSVEGAPAMSGLENLPARALVEEFYSRFR